MNIRVLLVFNRWKFYEDIAVKTLRTSYAKKQKEQKKKKVLREVTPIGVFLCWKKIETLKTQRRQRRRNAKKDTSTFVNVRTKFQAKKIQISRLLASALFYKLNGLLLFQTKREK
jgi:hypothetical protein